MPELNAKSIIRAGTITEPDRRWWATAGGKASYTLSRLYSIGIFDLAENTYAAFKELKNPHFEGLLPFVGGSIVATSALYYFTTPPQTYEISEPASTQVVPTQDGGKFIESHGSLFKDIRIAGTVGFRPAPVSSELIPGLSEAGGPRLSIPKTLQMFLNDERGLDPKEVTGFDEIMYLRNLFRCYFDLKALPHVGRRYVLVWTTKKDDEAWVAEPVSFVTTRDRSNPMGWSYQIQLRGLYLLDKVFPFEEDSLGFFGTLLGALQILSQAVDDIATALMQIKGAIDFVANLPANMLNGLMSGGFRIISAAMALKNSVTSFGDTVSRTVLQTMVSYSLALSQLFDKEFPPSGAIVLPAGTTQRSGVGEAWSQKKISDVRDSLGNIRRACAMILGLDQLWAPHLQLRVADYAKSYRDKHNRPPLTAGSPLNPSNIVLPSTGREVTIGVGEDIRGLAKKHMGSEAYWKQLVIMNNLRFPYVASTASEGVLGPGSRLVIPGGQADDQSMAVGQVINSDAASAAQSPALRHYGRDIRLRASSAGGASELSDLAISSRGDLDTIEGKENVEQAMMIKFSTEQGELATHPLFGAQFPIGSKVTLESFQDFMINTRRTILSDPRTARITELKMLVDGDQLMTRAKILLRDSNQDITISFAVRS